jgi:hypothetical protein
MAREKFGSGSTSIKRMCQSCFTLFEVNATSFGMNIPFFCFACRREENNSRAAQMWLQHEKHSGKHA